MSAANTMRAGRLDRSIIIRRKGETVNDYGSVVDEWQTIGEHRAELVTQSNSDTVTTQTVSEGGAINTIVRDISFRTRWISDLMISDTVVYSGHEFIIIELTEIPRRRGWQIKAQSRGA